MTHILNFTPKIIHVPNSEYCFTNTLRTRNAEFYSTKILHIPNPEFYSTNYSYTKSWILFYQHSSYPKSWILFYQHSSYPILAFFQLKKFCYSQIPHKKTLPLIDLKTLKATVYHKNSFSMWIMPSQIIFYFISSNMTNYKIHPWLSTQFQTTLKTDSPPPPL